MPEALLDSSVIIGLVFRHAAERDACAAAIPAGSKALCSRYVIYEVARGFLRSLLALHNQSFDYSSFAALHEAAHSGQRRFKAYEMQTLLGAFDDYLAALEREDGPSTGALKVEELRAKLRTWIRRGWKNLTTKFETVNEIGCKTVLQPPNVRADGRIDQNLPLDECGLTTACQLQTFVQNHLSDFEAVAKTLSGLPKSRQDKETKKRIEALGHLQSRKPGENFEGKKCFRCGDALICMEATEKQTIVTKNAKHFEPIAQVLQKNLTIAKSGHILNKSSD